MTATAPRPDPPSIDDATLARLRAGDFAAIDGVVRAWGGRVRIYVRRLLGSRHAAAEEWAEDLTHDVFVRVFEAAGECRRPTEFRAWVFRTARNLALDQLRTRALHRRALDVLERRAPAPAAGPAERTAAREFRGRFEDALRDLPEPYRSTFLLRDVEGLGYGEIAGVIGCSEKTVSSRLSRARRWLRARLKDDDPRGPEVSR